MVLATTRPRRPPFTALLFALCVLHGLALSVRLYDGAWTEEVNTRQASAIPLKVDLGGEIAVPVMPQPRPTQSRVPTKKPVPSSAPIQESVSATSTDSADPSAPEPVAGLRYRVSTDLKEIYLSALRARIEQRKQYPMQAKRLGQSGVVEVSFTVTQRGHIIRPRVTRASPFQRLNDSALEVVANLGTFDPLPAEFGQEELEVTLPIRYSLTN